MGTYRLYTDSQGLSQIEKINLSSTPAWTEAQATTTIAFREAAVGISRITIPPTAGSSLSFCPGSYRSVSKMGPCTSLDREMPDWWKT